MKALKKNVVVVEMSMDDVDFMLDRVFDTAKSILCGEEHDRLKDWIIKLDELRRN